MRRRSGWLEGTAITMTVLVLPLIFVFTALTVLVFAFGARRLLGLRFSFLHSGCRVPLCPWLEELVISSGNALCASVRKAYYRGYSSGPWQLHPRCRTCGGRAGVF
jgi:hypothetical protein